MESFPLIDAGKSVVREESPEAGVKKLVFDKQAFEIAPPLLRDSTFSSYIFISEALRRHLEYHSITGCKFRLLENCFDRKHDVASASKQKAE
jgi:hypothetical protein